MTHVQTAPPVPTWWAEPGRRATAHLMLPGQRTALCGSVMAVDARWVVGDRLTCVTCPKVAAAAGVTA